MAEIRRLARGGEYHFDLSGMDRSVVSPSGTITVTAVAESGKIEKYVVTVYPKSDSANLDKINSTIGGKNLRTILLTAESSMCLSAAAT